MFWCPFVCSVPSESDLFFSRIETAEFHCDAEITIAWGGDTSGPGCKSYESRD